MVTARDRNRDTVCLGLGANVGDRRMALCRAVQRLDADGRVCVEFDGGVAGLYETSPVGGPTGQRAYLNSAVRVTTTLSPIALLELALRVEASLGRVRGVPWGPRTIDIDVLLYGDRIVGGPRLTVPHPRLHERRFVLEPLAEIAPDWRHPVLGVTVRVLARRRAARATGETVVLVDAGGTEWYNA